VPEDAILHIIHQMYNYFNSQNISIICENFNNEVIFLVSSNEKLSMQNLTTGLSEVIAKLYETLSNVILLMGASNIFNNIDYLLTSYKEARTSHMALKKMKAQKGICFYDYISLLKSLSLINSDEYTTKSLYQKIESLINYDKIHQSNYFNTLKCFLDNGCNINVTSEKLYVHRHTLRNRLEKIKELSGIDFNDNYSKLSFSIAIHLYNFF
jgi:DNA-binding PucR family transcriptional regulator